MGSWCQLSGQLPLMLSHDINVDSGFHTMHPKVLDIPCTLPVGHCERGGKLTSGVSPHHNALCLSLTSQTSVKILSEALFFQDGG